MKKCFICKQIIPIGDEIVVSEKYQIYRHSTCNPIKVCYVCKKLFTLRESKVMIPGLSLELEIWRHEKCSPDRYKYKKYMYDSMPDDVKKLYDVLIEDDDIEKEIKVVPRKRRKLLPIIEDIIDNSIDISFDIPLLIRG